MLAALVCLRGNAQAALLLEDADGTAEMLSPAGHDAVYFARICAASPTTLRRCEAGELGAVIARYKGIGGYDWLATPLIPYLYSVEDASQVPERVSRERVQDLRLQYHDAHLMNLETNVKEGGGVHGDGTSLWARPTNGVSMPFGLRLPKHRTMPSSRR